ncbi:MAG: PD-(D/E)XK nuclease family protein [Candidatus Heimdallarchaeota archaeon]|nr:MAG: PD-(D/E)XK nuclease family protein [Candidatus Heimdallarchaeota archaeon]
MRYISPSLVKEYLFCPRSFSYRWMHHLSLISTNNSSVQERIDTFTSGFFSALSLWDAKTRPRTRFELEYLLSSKFRNHLEKFARNEEPTFRELDEKVFTLLLWLILNLWETEENFLPIMVNEFIQAPSLNLQGRPSAVFRYSNNSALILIQTFRSDFPHTQRLVTLQAALYARILKPMEFIPQSFLYIDYYRMNLIFRELNSSDFNNLDIFLKNFQIAIREENFDPPKNPPCKTCEFKWICKD